MLVLASLAHPQEAYLLSTFVCSLFKSWGIVLYLLLNNVTLTDLFRLDPQLCGVKLLI